MLYVSHWLSEIQSLCDRVAVLQDGLIQRILRPPFEGRRLVEAMLGEQFVALRHERRPAGDQLHARSGAAPFIRFRTVPWRLLRVERELRHAAGQVVVAYLAALVGDRVMQGMRPDSSAARISRSGLAGGTKPRIRSVERSIYLFFERMRGVCAEVT